MKTITLDNLHKTKLSDLVESVVSDIERVQELGIRINMDDWVSTDENWRLCAVCLGGAAACGFLTTEQLKGKIEAVGPVGLAKIVNHGMEDEVEIMIELFDSLRKLSWHSVWYQYKKLTNVELDISKLSRCADIAKLNIYCGYMYGVELKKMCTRLLRFAKELRKYNY